MQARCDAERGLEVASARAVEMTVFDDDNTSASATHRLKSMIVGTFREMPGLCVNVSQAVRLFGVAPSMCRSLLDDLVRSGELCKAPDGLYRLDSEHRL